jgi:hypothetical protein
MAGCCEHGDEPSFSTKGGEFLEKLSDCKLLKKDSQMNLMLHYLKFSEGLNAMFSGDQQRQF